MAFLAKSRPRSRSHVSLPLLKKRNPRFCQSSSKLKGYETLRISVSSVSRFEPCEFPSRVDRLPLSLSLHHLCFCLSSLSLCLPPNSLLFVRPFICTWPNAPPPVFRGPHQNPRVPAALQSFSVSPSTSRSPRWKVRNAPPFSFSDGSCKTFQALSGSFMCVYVPRDSGALMG